MAKMQAQTQEKKERIPVWMYPSTLAMMDGAIQQANYKSRSEFLEEAAKYYAGYVSAENAIQYLPPMLVAAFRGTVQNSESHICRLLFNLAVEIDMVMNILAAELNASPTWLKKCAAGASNTLRRHAVPFHSGRQRSTNTDHQKRDMMKMNSSSYKTYDDLPLMLSVPDVVVVLGISRAGAYELAHSREFPSIKVGNRIIIPKDKFLLWIEKRCGEG